MRTAETIVNEYLDLGYSLESLRVLAESRPEPVCSQMLSIIDDLRSKQGAEPAFDRVEDVECDTDGVVIFNAEEPLEGAHIVDFDVMAATAEPAAGDEESVSEVMIQDTDDAGADAEPDASVWSRRWHTDASEEGEAPAAELEETVADSGMDEQAGPAADSVEELFAGIETQDSPIGDDAETVLERGSDKIETFDHASECASESALSPESMGLGERSAVDDILSGITLEASASVSGSVVSLQTETSDYLPGSVAFPFEDSASVSMADLESAAVRQEDEEPVAEEEHDVSETASADESAMEAEDAGESVSESDMADAPEAEEAESPEMSDDAAVVDDGAEEEPEAGLSADEKEPAAEEDAVEEAAERSAPEGEAEETPLADAHNDETPETSEAPADEPVAGESDEGADAPAAEHGETESGEQSEAEHHPVLFAPGLANATRSGKLSRKERRRRDRAEKKKHKAGGKKAGKEKMRGPDLPEIILARSDGTDTMVPETELHAESHEAAVAEDAPKALPMPEEAARSEEEAPEQALPAETAAEEKLDEQDSAPEESLPADESGEDSGMPATSELALVLSREIEKAAAELEKDESVMMIANGGLDLRSDAYALLADSTPAGEKDDYEPEDSDEAGGNVILFRPSPAAFDEEEEYAEFGGMLEFTEPDAEEQALAGQYLRMLPPVDSEESAELSETAEDDSVAEPETAAMPPIARLGLLRALVGPAIHEDCADEPEIVAGDSDKDHVIVAIQPDEAEETVDAESARQELEAEYQRRLDEFAARLLEMQGLVAQKDSSVREKEAELSIRELELDSIRERLAREEARAAATNELLTEARAENGRRLAELDTYRGLHGEHERLFREFEDLRKAYNEVVVDVMPVLQGERDDLTLTVERQCEETEQLRTSLKSSRRRLAAGYALGAAASLMLIALPIANWMKASEENHMAAEQYQQVSELRERAEKAEQRNVDAEKKIFDLERTANIAQMELAKAKDANVQLTKLADQRTRELAAAKANGGSGKPGDMALSGAPQSDGQLRRNEVRDPAGHIDQVVAINRERYTQDDVNLASRNSRIPVSSVASNVRPQSGGAAASGLRPGAQREQQADRPGEVTASVKAGEGVAQVVYRVLGTRDPEVIDWVIRENNIKKDRRGNPRIYPDQKLKLPQGGRTGQAASAARR